MSYYDSKEFQSAVKACSLCFLFYFSVDEWNDCGIRMGSINHFSPTGPLQRPSHGKPVSHRPDRMKLLGNHMTKFCFWPVCDKTYCCGMQIIPPGIPQCPLLNLVSKPLFIFILFDLDTLFLFHWFLLLPFLYSPNAM